jgi:hypothetical protein
MKDGDKWHKAVDPIYPVPVKTQRQRQVPAEIDNIWGRSNYIPALPNIEFKTLQQEVDLLKKRVKELELELKKK